MFLIFNNIKWSLRRLVFKKRLFLGERPLQTTCAAEMELLYYQVLHSVRHDRLPIETDEAVSVFFKPLVLLGKFTYKLVVFKNSSQFCVRISN